MAPILIVALSLMPRQVSTAQTGWQWYKTDLHVHSVISADAYNDLGIMSQSAKAQGYSALFLTDHNLASSFPISSLTANNMVFEDSYRRWTSGTYGLPTSTTNVLTTTPVNTGTNSLQLASSASGYGETFVWASRGPNFRSGDIILKFSVYPTRIDTGSGVYVSASIGGDATVQKADGYTTSSGVISPGKSIVLVWQLGSVRTASSDANSRVLTYSLPYTLNTWNHYTINISDYLEDIPSVERPLDYNAVTYLKIAAAANGGTANAYFDTYSIMASSPVSPADEFVYRTSVIPTYDTSTFKIFPSLEMGVSKHAQRFNFGITDPSQFLSYWDGVDGILPAQQSGYPAMLNHPGSDGGASDQETISTQGEGADLMEVRQQGWIDNWDAILQQGVQMLGTGTSDTHRVFSGSSFATYVYGPTLTFDSLIRSIFDGRTYVAAGSFGDQGRVIFNLDSSSQDPYPARYPVYMPSTQSSANVHLVVTGGLKSGYIIRWIRNDTLLATESTVGASYERTKVISLGGARTYVRAEVRDPDGTLKGLTQPIFFVTVPGMPADKSYYIDSVVTADGRKYTKLFVKGITASGWDATGQVLTLTLKNPANALVDLRMSTGSAPQSIQVDGGTIPVTDSLTTFQAASSSMWYYSGVSRLLYLKALHAADTSSVSVAFANTGTITPTATYTQTATQTQTNQPTTLTFTPTADTYVQSDQPTTNFGASTQFITDNSPIKNMLLKFAVSGVGTQTIVNARLRIYCVDSSPLGGVFYRVADTTWSEGTVNWNTAPVADTNSLATLGAVAAGNWYEVGVSSLVNGDGTYSLKVSSTSIDGAYYSTKEGTAGFAPQLIVTTSAGPTPTITPTATQTPTATVTPSQTLTDTPTSTPTSTPTNTPTSSVSGTPTFTSTATLTPTSTSTPTDTPASTQNPGGDRDTTGVFRPSNGLLYLKNSNTSGFADIAINYGMPGDYPVVGDWDGDGDATVGIYRNGSFYLRNDNSIGFADLVFPFGVPGDQPLAGDWNNDGVDTIGVYRNGTFYLRNSNSAGTPEMSFGLGNPGDVGIAGDWNGDGFDTTGVFRPINGIIFLKNANSTGFADIALNYGVPGDKPVMGDWNNDGIDTIGIYRNGTFYLRNSNTNGFADLVFALGNPGDMPIAGNWDAIP